MQTFLDENIAMKDLILYFLHKDKDFQIAVMELYVRR
jgi:hypothetical protein